MLAKEGRWRHLARLSMVLSLVIFTIVLQGYLTLETKLLVTPNAVREIREAYGDFETVMYDGHTNLTAFGNARGVKGYLNLENVNKMDQDEMQAICTSPLAQPLFMSVILFIWVVTCFQYLRQILSFSYRLAMVPNTHSMKGRGVLKAEKDACGNRTGRHVVIRTTCTVKIAMILFVQVPNFIMNLFLLWLGCRWLIATLGFGEVLLNAIALEFVLNLHVILYTAIVPATMQTNLSSYLIDQPVRSEKPSVANMFGAFCLLFVAILVTFVYVVWLQAVLPDYNWDIAEPCALFMKKAAFIT